jgi:hypothetical protein
MQKPNWREWKHTPDVTVWQACALSLDINPQRLVPDTRLMARYPSKGPFFLARNFASKEVEEEFDLRQRLLLRNLPNYTFFPTRYRDRWEGSRREGNSLVRLPEFASWAVSVVMWEGMPPELIELAIALPRTELSPPTIPPPPISDRQTLLRQRKSVTIAEAAEILTGIAGWTKENRAAMDLIREAIQDDELEPESVHYFDEDAWTFDASRAVIDQGATTVTAANFNAWRARTFQSTESAQATDAPPQVTDEVQEQSAPSGATEVTLDGNDGQGEAATQASNAMEAFRRAVQTAEHSAEVAAEAIHHVSQNQGCKSSEANAEHEVSANVPEESGDKDAPVSSEAARKNRQEHDFAAERGCRRIILEHWDTIENLYGPSANGVSVQRFLRRESDKSKEGPALKTIQNRLIDLRKQKLIP